MNKFVVSIFVVVAALVALGGGYWWGTQKAPPAAVAGGPAAPGAGGPAGQGKGGPGVAGGGGVAVEVQKVAVKPMPTGITAVGSLRSEESITLRPESAGRISAITFQEGQRVAKDSPLVKLDAAIPQAEVAQASANLVLAKSKFERAVDLAQRSFISGQAKDEAENNLRVAEASLQLAQAKLAKTDIRAPFAGVIGLRSVSVGDYVKEGADLVNLESIDTLKVDFRVPEIYLKQVQVGQALSLTLDALPGRTFEGKVFAVNPLLDTAGRAVVIRASVRNADVGLRPGMFARVRLFTREAQDAKVVPETALVPAGDEQFVFRVVDGKALRTRVEIGQRREGVVEIMQGLDTGDTVVTAGQLKIRDGVNVRVAGAERTPTAAATEQGSAAKAGGAGNKAQAAPKT